MNRKYSLFKPMYINYRNSSITPPLQPFLFTPLSPPHTPTQTQSYFLCMEKLRLNLHDFLWSHSNPYICHTTHQLHCESMRACVCVRTCKFSPSHWGMEIKSILLHCFHLNVHFFMTWSTCVYAYVCVSVWICACMCVSNMQFVVECVHRYMLDRMCVLGLHWKVSDHMGVNGN